VGSRPAERSIARLSRPRVATAALLAALPVCVPDLPGTGALTAQTLGVQLPGARVRELAAGKCLVAARNLPDPNFGGSVVLLAEYGKDGAMGLIINVPTDVPVSRVLGDMKGAGERSEVVYFGGPVATTGVVALRRAGGAGTDSRRVIEGVHLITSRESLEAAIASGAKPGELRVYLGYAGWGSGQLEREMARGAWHVVPADADLVFDPEPESVWRRQINRTERLIARPIAPAWPAS
jgi:putative transcriptional regulator